jgi:hypothetical protein
MGSGLLSGFRRPASALPSVRIHVCAVWVSPGLSLSIFLEVLYAKHGFTNCAETQPCRVGGEQDAKPYRYKCLDYGMYIGSWVNCSGDLKDLSGPRRIKYPTECCEVGSEPGGLRIN